MMMQAAIETAATSWALPPPPVPAADSPDTTIVRRVLAGDKQAYSVLVERYSPRMFRLCMAVTRDRDAAEDCLQKTFLLALERLHQFRAEAQFSTWLTRIALNAALSDRRRRMARAASDLPIETAVEGRAPLFLPDRTGDPEAALFRSELRQRIEQALATLSPVLRVVLILREIEELDTEETARALGLSQSAVKTRLLRARLKMREKLAPWLDGRRTAPALRPV